MGYTVFNTNKNDQLKEPMFFGQGVNVSRYDQQKYKIFEDSIEKQLGFFWVPNEVDVSKDRIDFQNLPENEKHIFLSNLRYQTLLDSVQGRSPNMAFLPIVSIPELETWIEVWSFAETIHSRSYTHIIRNVVNDPAEVFDGIVEDEEILKRAGSVSKYYDDLIDAVQKYQQGIFEGTMRDLKKKLYLCMMSVNILEAIRFYVSFACSFAFAERELMEGNAKIIKFVSRDEQCHQAATQHILKLFNRGAEGAEMALVAAGCYDESRQMFLDAANEEIEWAKYLFKDGGMIGLNEQIVVQYIKYLTNTRMKYVGLEPVFEPTSNPIPWINTWLGSDNVQVAPQETEISSYLTGAIDTEVSDDDLSDLEL